MVDSRVRTPLLNLFAREDTVRQICGEHVNHVTSSNEAGIRPAHLERQVCGVLCLATATRVALSNL